MGSRSDSGRTVLELIAAGDVEAAAGLYDGRAPSVREYIVQLCSSELIDEATLAAFIDFRGRAASVPPDADADEVLRRAARAAAAGRLDLREAESADCRATTELIVARMNGELIRSEQPLEQHLERCSTCRRTAERLTDAEAALSGRGGEAPPDEIRGAWLELVGIEKVAEPNKVAAAGMQAGPEQPESAAEDPQAPEPKATIQLRTRRGGVVGAARRLGSSMRPHQ